MGGGAHPPIPDHKIYNIDGVKELEWVQSELAKKGLKDPWIRNEVWRFRQWPGFAKSFNIMIFRGLKYAAPAMVLTVIVDQMLGISKNKRTLDHGEHH